MNNKGQMVNLFVGLLWTFIIITLLVALIPGMSDVLTMGQDSEHLNCPGYTNADNPSLSYNSSLSSRTSTIGCMAFKLYIPYIVLGVLMFIVGAILYGRSQSQQGYQQYG
jgi:predicted membrane channel-forming protein YqfA (hemolysin III family)